MSVDNPLNNLKDIHIPSAISYWPPAIGWWILISLFFLIIFFSLFFVWKSYKRKKPKYEALRILKDIQTKFEKNNNESETIKELSILIRRTALTYYNRKEVASLHGLDWLKFLDKSVNKKEFTQGVGVIFGNEIYKENPKIQTLSLFSVVRDWINGISEKINK